MKKILSTVLVLIAIIVIFSIHPTDDLRNTSKEPSILREYLDNLSYKTKPEETIIDQHLKQYREYLKIAR